MRRSRVVVAVVVVVVWGLAAPLAMAADGCMAMSAMCEGPCGVSSCVVSAASSTGASNAVTAAYLAPPLHASAPALRVLELPPK